MIHFLSLFNLLRFIIDLLGQLLSDMLQNVAVFFDGLARVQFRKYLLSLLEHLAVSGALHSALHFLRKCF